MPALKRRGDTSERLVLIDRAILHLRAAVIGLRQARLYQSGDNAAYALKSAEAGRRRVEKQEDADIVPKQIEDGGK